MEKPSFERIVDGVVAGDATYAKDAYCFVREALALLLGEVRKQTGGPERHVSGPELVDAFRRLARRRFGPMALIVLETWGVRRTRDVGNIVFRLIEAGAFDRSSEDKPEDFDGLFDFEEAFVAPYRPRSGGGGGRSKKAGT